MAGNSARRFVWSAWLSRTSPGAGRHVRPLDGVAEQVLQLGEQLEERRAAAEGEVHRGVVRHALGHRGGDAPRTRSRRR